MNHGPGIPGGALNFHTRGGVFKTLRTLLKGVRRAHDTAGFHGSWLLKTFPGSCVIGA
jgi:hypothetical protein